jgi:phenylacetate-CoA ligase
LPFCGAEAEALLSLADIASLQNQALAGAVEYLFCCSPFYKKMLASAGLKAGDIRTTDDLLKVPTTSKQDLAGNNGDFLCVDARRIVDTVTTSGTTGRPTLYMLTERDLQRLAYNESLSFSCLGIAEDDLAFLSVTMDRCFMAGLAYYQGLRKLGVNVLRLGPASPAMHLGLIDQLNPTLIVSVPSFLKRIAAYAQEQGRDLRNCSISKAVCIGEPVRREDLSLNPLGVSVEESWGLRVSSTYGVTELATSCCECQYGCGGHLHPELLYVEILDKAGARLAPGETGEIVATTFGVEAMPLLRFRTGDYSFLITEACQCGRQTSRLGPILGRKDQLLKIKGTSVFPAAITRAMDSIPEVRSYVMIASCSDALSDQLQVLYSTEHDPAEISARVKDRIQGEAKVAPEIRSVSAAEVEALQNIRGSRKRRIFIDRR